MRKLLVWILLVGFACLLGNRALAAPPPQNPAVELRVNGGSQVAGVAMQVFLLRTVLTVLPAILMPSRLAS